MPCFCAKFNRCILTIEQREHHLTVITNLLQEAEMDQNFMDGIITGDETWAYRYDLETKHQSLQWKSPKSPRPKKVHQVCSKVKVMLIVFFDMEGIVHHEYIPEGQTMNERYMLKF